MAAKAHEISLEAGSKMAAAMKDVVNGAAGITEFVVESARDLVQFMVRRGQMTQEEADKLMREAEDFQSRRKPRSSGSSKPSGQKPGGAGSSRKPAKVKAAPKKPAPKAVAKKPASKKPAAKKPAPRKPAPKAAAKSKPKAKPSGKAAKGKKR